jgi:hypothetical protein
MTALVTVADYVSDARVLLQDTVEPYRYADTELVTGLNFALMECRKQRIDLFPRPDHLADLHDTG